MNNVILIGRLAKNPELNYTPNTQTAVCRFTIAVDRPKRKNEESKADFLRVVVFGKQAESCDRYLEKGRQVAVRGSIQTDSYKNREGVTVYTTEILAENVEFLGGNTNYQNKEKTTQNQNISRADVSFSGFDDMSDTFQSTFDDIPF